MSQSIAVLGSNQIPLTYKVPVPGTLTPIAASAVFDGSAALTFVPCLSFYDSDGNLIARAPAPVVAAGGSAEVSWFPRVASASTGIRYDVDPQDGGYLALDVGEESGNPGYVHITNADSGGFGDGFTYTWNGPGDDNEGFQVILEGGGNETGGVQFTSSPGGTDAGFNVNLRGQSTTTGVDFDIATGTDSGGFTFTDTAGGDSTGFKFKSAPGGNTGGMAFELDTGNPGTSGGFHFDESGTLTPGGFHVLDFSGQVLDTYLDNSAPAIGFLGATPAARQATPVTLADVIAVLQTFGFCS